MIEDLPNRDKSISDIKNLINITRMQGFIGLYHPFKGRVYAGAGVIEDDDLYSAYLFGENAILSRPQYGNYLFKENIEAHCLRFDTNRLHGMVVPPSEGGIVNNPEDSSLFEPASSPGMIQGAHRYSEISKLAPQITGIIIDDFWANYDRDKGISYKDLMDIKGALLGKEVDSSGRVNHQSPATTPDLKLYIVTYEWEIEPKDKKALELIDGVSFWIYNQEKYYADFRRFIGMIRTGYPGKEIIPGIYLHNTDYGDMTQRSIAYLLQESIMLYDQGYASGVLLFAGHWLVKNNITRDRCQEINLSDILYRTYYLHLGRISGQIIDSDTGMPIEKARVRIVSHGREAGIERIATKKHTNPLGIFHFSGWAGYGGGGFAYALHIEKEGYQTYEGGFLIFPKVEASLPVISMVRMEAYVPEKIPPRKPHVIDMGYALMHPAASAELQRTYYEGQSGTIGDLTYPCCTAVNLKRHHVWGYDESQILSVLSSADFGRKQPDIWDDDQMALRGLEALKEKLSGCPCGLAIGDVPGKGQSHAVIIYWTDPATWKFWDPRSHSNVPLHCRYVIA